MVNASVICVISGFRREVDENCALLGYYAASSGNFLPKFRDIIGPIFRSQDSKRKPEERSSDMGDIFCAMNCPNVSYFVEHKSYAVPDMQ